MMQILSAIMLELIAGTTPGAGSTQAAPPEARSRSAPGIERPDLIGAWRVVALSTDNGVNALVPDDPAYVGKTMTIAKDHLWWEGVDYHDLSSSFRDICLGPKATPMPPAQARRFAADYSVQLGKLAVTPSVTYAVTCTSGDWGPKEPQGWPLVQLDHDVLVMPWYDGGLLKLARTH